MNWQDIDLNQTCGGCPEQYDAIYKDKIVGYLRLRHGFFSVNCYDERVYEAHPKGDGLFEWEERSFYLKKAKKKIAKYLKKINHERAN